MTSDNIPGKSSTAEQVDREIDQRDLEPYEDQHAEELRVNGAKLFTQAMEQTRMALCVSDPFAKDEPIVFVNQAFVELTGYSREEILGNNCRFLQGEHTDPEAVARIRSALETREVRVVDILNYRKDGTPFWNALHVGPIMDEKGELAYYYGSQWDITEILEKKDEVARHRQVAMELEHRTGNLFAVIQSIVSLTARSETDTQVLASKIGERISALATAHKASLKAGDAEREDTDLETLARSILAPYRDGREDRVQFTGEKVSIPANVITPLGLTLHELATNAVKYGALSSQSGHIGIDWQLKDGVLTIDWAETGGPAIDVSAGDPAVQGGGMGSRIVEAMLRSESGNIAMDFQPSGLVAAITLPLGTGA